MESMGRSNRKRLFLFAQIAVSLGPRLSRSLA